MTWLVTNIQILSPTHFVSNIRHQHRCESHHVTRQLRLKFQIGSSISSERSKIRNHIFLDKLSKYTAQLLTYFVDENWSRKRHKSSNQNTAKSEMGCELILIEREQTCFIVIELVSFWFCIISTYHVFIVFDINFISQRNIIL